MAYRRRKRRMIRRSFKRRGRVKRRGVRPMRIGYRV